MQVQACDMFSTPCWRCTDELLHDQAGSGLDGSGKRPEIPVHQKVQLDPQRNTSPGKRTHGEFDLAVHHVQTTAVGSMRTPPSDPQDQADAT